MFDVGNRRGAWLATALAMVALPAVARDNASVPLANVLAIAKPYPNLLLEIRLQLAAADLKRDQVTCVAERLGTEWAQLSGASRGPYTCRIGKRQLSVATVATYFDKAGYRVKPSDTALPTRAAKITEARLTWKWK